MPSSQSSNYKCKAKITTELEWEDEASHHTAKQYIDEGFGRIAAIRELRDAMKQNKVKFDIKCEKVK